MIRRSIARLAALLAIAAVAVVAYVIVHDNVKTSSKTTHHRRHHPRRAAPRKGHKTTSKPVYYTVKSGDTLSEIVDRTHVSLAAITKLNPSLTPPYALTTGQRLRLRR